LSAGSRDFILKVKEDIVRYANEGAEVVAEAIRDIIGKLHAGVLAAAIILNPTNKERRCYPAGAFFGNQVTLGLDFISLTLDLISI
jgi:hypothetical protein